MAFFSIRPGAGNLDPAVVEYFLRSDTHDGLARRPDGGIVTPPQSAINALMQALASGLLTPAGPEGEQLARSYGYAPAGPTDPNFVGNLVNSGANVADIVMGQVPGTPANTQPTIQLRELLLRAIQSQEAAKLARDSAEAAIRQGDTALAQQQQQIANKHEIDSRTLDQQASQFASTHGLAVEESAFRRDLANRQFALDTERFGLESELGRGDLALRGELGRGALDLQNRQFGLETDKYTSELAANPKNLIQSALFQGSRTPGGIQPDATGFGGNANTPTAGGTNQFASYMGQQVPVSAGVNALLNRSNIAPTGTFQGQGFMTSLQDMQYNPNLRLNSSNMDAASLRNVMQDESLGAELDSTLRAQGQTSGSFAQALRGVTPDRARSNALTTAY